MAVETRETLAAALQPLIVAAARCDLANAAATVASMSAAFPLAGPVVSALRARLVAARDARVICDRGAPPVFWGRIAKPSPATLDFSIDAVLMTGPGAHHLHPRGELSLAFALDGDPRFDGHPEDWVVEGPGSSHTPTVAGGTMLIVYFLPGGAMEFTAVPKS